MKQQTKDKLRFYIEFIRYYILHPVRSVIFYIGFCYAAFASMYMLPDSDPDSIEYVAWIYHFNATLTTIVVYFLLVGLFTLYDASARRRFVLTKKELTHTFSEHIGVLRSYEFLWDAACFVILPLIFGMEIFKEPLCLLFGRESFSPWAAYAWYLLIIFPVYMVINILSRVRARDFWRELSYENACGMHFDVLKLIGFYILVLFGYSFFSRFYLPIIPHLLKQFKNPAVLLAILVIIFLICSFWYLRAFLVRRRFWKLLKKTCRENGYTLSKIRAPYRSLFTKNGEYAFTVKAHEKTYACKMLAAINRGADMLFFENGDGVCRRVLKVRGVELPIKTYNKKFCYDFEYEGADAKILILSPSPITPYVGVGGIKHALDNGSIVHGYVIYAGQGFVNALNRNCVGRMR